ncbi:HD domain-containing protein [Serpentinicella alkaliphila]|uniref:Putative hydrolase (HD superfamily) n=1 Tax=Serpentinicella alkaliphila TaxID=1734049 RepID=A0A4V2T4V5_9FIRM|nr:HD domain-containing protein [Serpentinicella alkaliphila]QUH25616.1 HD domain-containing protein [Serpentinicella alkaliphila]TCQ06674.1 putative hydrolase (HD superfamily) [Serpentinicella alkaliphila]
MNREKALQILHKNLKSDHLIKHSYAVESVMRELAKRLQPDKEDLWAMTGLLHDLDADIVDYTTAPQLHGLKTVEILKSENLGNDQMYSAICAHNKESGVEISSVIDQAIFAADPITGFITAIALVYPDKKVSSVKVKSVTKRMKELRFAAGADRDAMRSIEKLGMDFNAFVEIALKAMESIASDLGL